MTTRAEVRLEVLHVPDCPNLPPLLDRLRALTNLPIRTREIHTDSEATNSGMAGSPTLLINGADPFTTGDRREWGMSCRIYRDERGQPVPVPSLAQLRAVLSAWRTRALPLDPTEKRVQQAILRSFAATGHAPDAAELASTIADAGRPADEVLAALHDQDAIRLGSDGPDPHPHPGRTARYPAVRPPLSNLTDPPLEMAMTSQDAKQLVTLIRAQFGLPDLIAHLTRLLCTTGRPVTPEQVAAAGGWTAEKVRAELARHPGVDWADDGRILGFGMTLRPTPHRFTTNDGHTAYGFCASDALIYPVILGQPGQIESTCAVTGQPIHVELTPDEVVSVDPPEAVVSRVRPDHAVADVRAEICALGNFFSTPNTAADWQAHHPSATLVPVRRDFETNREAVIELGWAPKHVG
jgi:alkylmercury lyase